MRDSESKCLGKAGSIQLNLSQIGNSRPPPHPPIAGRGDVGRFLFMSARAAQFLDVNRNPSATVTCDAGCLSTFAFARLDPTLIFMDAQTSPS